MDLCHVNLFRSQQKTVLRFKFCCKICKNIIRNVNLCFTVFHSVSHPNFALHLPAVTHSCAPALFHQYTHLAFLLWSEVYSLKRVKLSFFSGKPQPQQHLMQSEKRCRPSSPVLPFPGVCSHHPGYACWFIIMCAPLCPQTSLFYNCSPF